MSASVQRRPVGFSRGSLDRWLPTVLFLAAVVVVWDLLVRVLDISPFVIPSPGAVAGAVVENAGLIAENSGVTLLEATLGFALGNGIAIATSAVFTYWGFLRNTAYPIVLAVQAIPLIAVAPILTVWFGPGMLAKVMLAAFLCGTIMLVNMVRGLSSADEETLELVHSLKASRWQELRMVRLPSSLPYLFVALKLGAASALVAAIAAEYLGSLEGLGHLLILSKMELDTALMWAVVLVATIIGMLAYGAVALIERRTLRWQPEEEAGRV